MRSPPLSLGLVFDGLVLADGFAVLHGHLGLVGAHLFALPGEEKNVVRNDLQLPKQFIG